MLSQSLELDASFSWSLGFSPWAGPGFLLAGPGRFQEVQGRPELHNGVLRVPSECLSLSVDGRALDASGLR